MKTTIINNTITYNSIQYTPPHHLNYAITDFKNNQEVTISPINDQLRVEYNSIVEYWNRVPNTNSVNDQITDAVTISETVSDKNTSFPNSVSNQITDSVTQSKSKKVSK